MKRCRRAGEIMSSVLEQVIPDKKPLFSKTQALLEASKCINCFDAPCSKACPTNIDVGKFISQIAHNNIKGAAKTILSANILGYSCARVCPVDVLCQAACVHNEQKVTPVKIGRLQQYATKMAINKYGFSNLLDSPKAKTGKKVALIGAGPASLAAAAELMLYGHQAIIFEKKQLAGGLNALGIAPYKLKQEAAQNEIEWLISLGVEIRKGVEVDSKNAAELLQQYDAVFLGIGIGEDSFLNIENSNCKGVVGALDLIEKIKTNKKFTLSKIKTAHVIGGGNTAIDIGHELKLLGVENVIMVYRRTKNDMPGYDFELKSALANGMHLAENTVVEKILQRKGKLFGVKVKNTKYKKAGKFSSDLLVMAIGQNKNTALPKCFSGVEVDDQGCVIVNPQTGQTFNPKVFAAGDCVNGGKEVVNAVAGAKLAVSTLLQYLDKPKESLKSKNEDGACYA